MADVQPVDYSGVVQAGMNLFPDIVNQDLQRQLAQSQIAGNQAQARNLDVTTQQHVRDQADDDAYHAAFDEYLTNPTPRGAADLITRFPKYAQQIKQGWDTLDKGTQSADLRQMAEIYSAARGGKYDLAAQAMQSRIDADKAASGQVDPHDQAILEALKSNDPVQQKAAMGMIGVQLSAITGPEHFSSTYDAVNPDAKPYTLQAGDTRMSGDNQIVASSPYIKGADGTIYDARTVGGGGQTSGGGASSGVQYVNGWSPRASHGGDNTDAQVDGYINHVTSTLGITPDTPLSAANIPQLAAAMSQFESGGKPTALSIRNNNPGNIRGKDGAFRKFDTLEQGQAAQYALLGKYIKRGQNTVRSIIEGIPKGGGAPAAAPGGPRVLIPGKPQDPKPIKMTPEEVAAEGLDPTLVYYRDKDGVPQAVSGQTRPNANLKTWPAPALASRSSNNAALVNIVSTAKLFDPKNNTPAAKTARKAVGFGTGALGDYVTQWNNPEGTPARAAVGQIGGIIIKDTSGAAVSLSEDERLRKWIPYVTDRPEVIHDKLQNLERELRIRNQSLDDTYNENQGYRPYVEATAPVRVRSIQEAMKLPKGTTFIDPKGVKRVR